MMNDRETIDVPNINQWKHENKKKAEENYQRMYNNSVNGERTRRTGKKRKTHYNTSNKKLKMLLGATVLGAVLTIGITKLTSDMWDNAVVNGMISEFQENVIAKESHRTDSNEGYYYDYIDLAQTIKGMDDFDEGVYYLAQTIGDYQTGLVLEHTEYESFTNYMEVKGYEDSDEFRKDIKKRIILKKDIDSDKKELERMLQADTDDNTNTLESGIGGK